MDLLQVLAMAVGAFAGTIAGEMTLTRWRRRRQRRAQEAEAARLADIRRRAIALRDEKRAAGESGLVVVDNISGAIEWVATPVAMVGPEGRA